MRWLIFLGLVCVARAGQLITGCNDPGQVDNAKREGNNFDDGATVTFTCNSGFRLKGKGAVTCQDVGGFNYDWVPGLPSCERVKCGAPEPAKANSKLTFNSDGNIGDKAWYKCDDGFLPKRRDIVCELNGDNANWSDGAPECRKIQCGDPRPAGENGRLDFDGDRDIGDRATYRCNPGFEPKRREIVCERDGDEANWSAGPPTCEDKTCPKFDERKNTEVAVKEPGDKAAHIDITLMTAQDEGSGLRDVVCTPPPGRILAALGPCDIKCTATDNAGNACEGSYTITVVDRAPKCKKGFKASGGRCFKIIEDDLFFEVACKRCQKEGGFLANARDRDESEEVGEFLKSENAKGDYWFNLQSFCSDSSRTWQTVELNTVKFDGWRSNPGSGECAMMGRPTKNSKRGKIWGKACCYHRLPAVCEA